MLTNLSRLDIWLLARCIVGYKAEAAHLKGARSDVMMLINYMEGLNFKARELELKMKMSDEDYAKVVGCDPETAIPLSDGNDERNWVIIPATELKNLPPVEWLVKGEIPKRGLVVLFGQSGAGKSFLSLDYALRLAQDRCVVYIAAEGEYGYRQRVAAWCQHHHMNEGNLYICLGAVNLYEAEDYNAFINKIAFLRPDLVVVDTLAMCMTGANENDTRDMGLVIRACKAMQRQVDTTVMIVHHVSKGGIAERGSSALRGAADTMIKLTPLDEVISIESSKTKDIAPFPTRYIRLLPIHLGFDEDNNPVHTPVVVPASLVLQQKDDPLTNNQRKVLDSLTQPLLDGGATITDIAEYAEMERGSVWRALNSLSRRRFVSKNGSLHSITNEGRTFIGLEPVGSDSSDSLWQRDKASGTKKSTRATSESSESVSQFPSNRKNNESDFDDSESDDDPIQASFDEMTHSRRKWRNQYELGN